MSKKQRAAWEYLPNFESKSIAVTIFINHDEMVKKNHNEEVKKW